MRFVIGIILALTLSNARAEVWTNHLGRAFSATLLAVNDEGATFVFAVDGATNTLPLAELAPASVRRACVQMDFAPIPPALAATFAQARRDLRRLRDLLADGRLTEEAVQTRRLGIRAAFIQRYRENGLPESDLPALLRRLERED